LETWHSGGAFLDGGLDSPKIIPNGHSHVCILILVMGVDAIYGLGKIRVSKGIFKVHMEVQIVAMCRNQLIQPKLC